MKVKAVDIARELGLSKATVSLALNDKPGVNPQTKKMIFDYREQMEKNLASQINSVQKDLQTIKVIFVNNNLNVVFDSEFDLLTEVLTAFDKTSKKMGFSISITYVNILEDSLAEIINECNSANVAGVILYATEMQQSDYEIFKNINKPMIIYDNDFEDTYHHRVCIDNISAAKMAVDYLLKKNCKTILYLANEIDIYNFRQRREGFRQAMEMNGLNFSSNMIIPTGKTIKTVYEKMKNHVDLNNLPDAFIMENYQVAIGTINFMRENGIIIPDHISLIGIDEVPYFITGDCKLTSIKIAHYDRAVMVMLLLQREIAESIPTKFKVLSDCQLMEGNSVRC